MSDPKKPETPDEAETERVEPQPTDQTNVEDAELVAEAEAHWTDRYGNTKTTSADDGDADEPAKDPAWKYGAAGAVYTADEVETVERTVEPEHPQDASTLDQDHLAGPDEMEDDDEPEQRSLASQILRVLLILLVGAVLILWAGPRIAPNLPSGLAPVAAWLTPGGTAADARIAAVEQRLTQREAAQNARLDALEGGPDMAAVNEALAQQAAELMAQINDLSDQVAATDGAEIEARLTRAETVMEGLRAELETLRASLTGLATTTQGIANDTAGLPEAAAQMGEALTARIEGLQAELEAMASRQGEMSQRIDEAKATAERQVAEADARVAQAEAQAAADITSAVALAEINALANALQSGRSFSTELDAIAASADVPAALTANAPTGIASSAALEESFPSMAHEAIRASIVAEAGDSVVSRAAAELRARTVGRSIVETEGDSTDAILSRVEARLREGALQEALAEAQSLPPAAAHVMSDWTERLQARADTLAAFQTLSGTLAADQ